MYMILDNFTEKKIGRSIHGQVPIPGTAPEADTSVPLVTWHFHWEWFVLPGRLGDYSYSYIMIYIYIDRYNL